MTEANFPTFFAGTLSADGYCSYLDNIYEPHDNWRAYLIKGGAGMGKSTLMKGVAAFVASRGRQVELVNCPSDPDSLDAAIFPDIKACIMDATDPHIVNPQLPELSEVLINLGDHCDRERLAQSRAAALKINSRTKKLFARANRYISACSSLLNDTYRLAYDCADIRRAATFGTRLAERLLPDRSKKGKEQVRFLSAVTPDGLIHRANTVSQMCDRVVAVEDEYGAVSRVIMSAVRMTALELGWDIITCMCPFAPDSKPEHVIVPELRLGFVTQNRWLKTPTTERTIHARRFTDVTEIHRRRERLSFNRRAINELVGGTVETLWQARDAHSELEKFYIECMDFEAVGARLEQIKAELGKRIEDAEK